MIKNNDEYSALKSLLVHEGYAIFIRGIMESFEMQYVKLRKCKKDNTFYATQGALNENEYIREWVKSEIEEYEKSTQGEANNE